MPPSRPLVVVDLSPANPAGAHEERVELLHHRFRLVRIGLGSDRKALRAEVSRRATRADAFSVTGLDDPRELERLRELASGTTVTDGRCLDEVLQELAVRRIQGDQPGHLDNARTVVVGTGHRRAVRILREFTDNLEFTDIGQRLDLSARVASVPVAGPVARATVAPLRLLPQAVRSAAAASGAAAGTALARRYAVDCDVLVATYDELAAFGLDDLAGKTVITSSLADEEIANLAALDVDLVVDSTPRPFRGTSTPALLEAMMLASVGGGPLTDDDLLDFIVSAQLEPRLLRPNGPRRRSRFAFVIHPLSQEYFTKIEPLGTVARHAPQPVLDLVEKAVAYAPPFVYSHVTGVRSPTGAEAEGWLITVGGTPKELMAHSPEFTYARLLSAAETARRLGAQVMGLGAFTKVVGDAGATVARRAPLPITTGNSYSASGALWAAHQASERLGLVEVDADGRMHGSAMVVGATGSIGSVCARLLALAADELWLVSPETAKLLELKRDIEKDGPRATVHVAATPDPHLGDMDVIVTATSGAGKRVLDIMAVKPGCVITDVARPLDLSPAEVAKRPDVLVIESGEIELPGEVRMKNIGLPPGVAYACLAETVVLALEGRYESFTVGRNIEWEKVKEIYRLGLKHGMRLAAMSGVNGVFSDADLARVRELALERRAASSPGSAGPVSRSDTRS
ncbi:dehydrogenase [Nocardioides panacisoli]|uniref:Serine carboxypeptidase n=1 Tax=Nocardioides panacisoli TaxID=627624 RepID=A0ABP7IVI8_9ACTN